MKKLICFLLSLMLLLPAFALAETETEELEIEEIIDTEEYGEEETEEVPPLLYWPTSTISWTANLFPNRS